jgi:hypothetical protein
VTPQEALDYLRARLPEVEATSTRARPRWSAVDVEAMTVIATLRLVPPAAPIRRIPDGLSPAMLEALIAIHARGSAYLHCATERALRRRCLVMPAATQPWKTQLTYKGIQTVARIRGDQ